MKTSYSRSRLGFSRSDLVVSIACVAAMAGLVLPGVQAARIDTARALCQDNLRKLGKGFQEFERVQLGFPPRRTGFNNGAPYHGWGPHILPYADEESLANRYNLKLDYFDPGNKEVTETKVKMFLCPAAPSDRFIKIQAQAVAKSENPDKDTVFSVDAGANDYITSNGVSIPRSGYGINAIDGAGNQRQPTADDAYVPLVKITDGLSCTLLLIEQAGRPDVWRGGKKTEGGTQFGVSPNARGTWGGWGSIAFGPSGPDGVSAAKGDATDCTVNCNNWFGIYGFHDEGANILLCDGSVRFVGKKLHPLVFAYLTIRDDGHLIADSDY